MGAFCADLRLAEVARIVRTARCEKKQLWKLALEAMAKTLPTFSGAKSDHILPPPDGRRNFFSPSRRFFPDRSV